MAIVGGYMVKTGCLIVLQQYEVDKSSNEVQESPRIRQELLTMIQVVDCAY